MVNDKARRSVIQFEDVSFEYPGAETDSIHHISLDVKEGEFLVLTGGSGCGKTTLTRLVNGLGEQFYEGTLKGRITLLGRNISEYPLYEIGKKVGSIFQDPKSQFFASYSPVSDSKDEQSRIISRFFIAASNTSKEVSPSFNIRTRIKLPYAA